MNNPFDYTPHELCDKAFRELLTWPLMNGANEDFMRDIRRGKMFGVLIVHPIDSTKLTALYAFSGQIAGRYDWEGFVPPVFDYLNPEGYFKKEEAAITAINHEVERIVASTEYRVAEERLHTVRTQADTAIETARRKRIDAIENAVGNNDELIKLHQFYKAEIHRTKVYHRTIIAEAETAFRAFTDKIEALKEERHQRSDALQRWLFQNFILTNENGERASLEDIFTTSPYSSGYVPSGAGECCAPKLLNYAFTHHLHPLYIAEYWYGKSPIGEVRVHGQHYPACQGRCRPILNWMLGDNIPSPPTPPSNYEIIILNYETDYLVVNKPAGLLSVPGKTNEPSVQQIIHNSPSAPTSTDYYEFQPVHRLDQDTSGLLIVARNEEAYKRLQALFAKRKVEKTYVALLDGDLLSFPDEGTITLPLAPDINDRPRQRVDFENGKSAVTLYKIKERRPDGTTLVEFHPLTGRTHQLRVHAAHQLGLGTPIVGDRLYGKGRQQASRLMLHASAIEFCYPADQRQHYECPANFKYNGL